MMEYLLKASTIIGVALLFYKCLLQQETFFKANRFFFIVFLVLAFLMPLVSLPQLVKYQGYLSSLFEIANNHLKEGSDITKVSPQVADEAVPNYSPPPTTGLKANAEEVVSEPFIRLPETLEDWLFMLYLFGVAVFTLNLLFQVANIALKILRSKDTIRDGKYVIVNLESKQAPCSFFNFIFICPEGYEYETYEQIIAHEKHHANAAHSLDLILAEIAVIILWFNPLMWLYKREIEKNLEYDTDFVLLHKEEVPKDQYQFNLLQIAVPNKPLSITTNYNQSLLKQRILMMNSKKSNLGSYWKYSFIAPLLLGTLLFLNKPATGQPTIVSTEVSASSQREKISKREQVKSISRAQRKGKANPININVNNEDISQGFWYSYQTENEYCIDFKGNLNSSRWNISNCFNKSEFSKEGDNTFTLKREAGIMTLTGKLDQDVSQGKYIFTKESSFENYLAQNNLVNRDKNLMFHLFIQNVTRAYVNDLRKSFESLDGDQLLAMAIHRVDKAFIEDLSKAGFKNLEADEIVAAKIHSVTVDNIKEMRSLGFGDLDLEEMISLRIHDVTGEYINELKSAGFSGLDLDEVVTAKIHGVNSKSIKEIQELGFEKLSLDKIVELKIHGINASYIADLKSAGFSKLKLDEIIQAKIHEVTPKSIKEIQALGFSNLSFKDITELKLHDVDASYISELKEAGFKNLTKDQVLEAKIHGVNAAVIKEIQSLGYKDLSLRKIVEAKIHGVDGRLLEGLKSAGIKNPEFSDVVEAKIHGVDGEFIKESRKDGYDYQSIDEYINLKIHGIARNSRKGN